MHTICKVLHPSIWLMSNMLSNMSITLYIDLKLNIKIYNIHYNIFTRSVVALSLFSKTCRTVVSTLVEVWRSFGSSERFCGSVACISCWVSSADCKICSSGSRIAIVAWACSNEYYFFIIILINYTSIASCWLSSWSSMSRIGGVYKTKYDELFSIF